jgi:tetratricopeptide (TPR) repeat protein
MKKNCILLILFALSFSFVGQTLKNAQALYNQQHYTEAGKLFQSLLKRRPNDGIVNYGYGMNLVKSDQQETALPYLQKAVTKNISAAYPTLCDLYFQLYYFDEAVTTIQDYLALPTISAADSKKYSALLIRAKLGADMIQHVEIVTIVDSLQVNKKNFFQLYKFSKDLGTIFPSQLLDKHEPTDMLAFRSQRGNRIVFADSLHGKAALYSTFQMVDRWSDPMPLSNVVNDYGTALNDPFVSSDGITLYFVAKGVHSLGGYDLFITRYNMQDNKYYTPVNYGMPFNSIYNDYLLIIDDVNNIGWFATDRFQPAGKVMIYTFIPNTERKIIKSDDKAYIRNAAQLKTYRWGVMPKIHNMITIDSLKDSTTTNNNIMHFVINDTLIYSSPTQFKSDQARQLFIQADTLSKNITALQQKLIAKRQAYSDAQSQEEKTVLEPQILALEQQVIKLRSQPMLLINNARDLEIKALQGSQQP